MFTQSAAWSRNTRHAAPASLFMDMNSFFASVEQQEWVELRGKPVMVVPVAAETTCAIAASYEAKALGIKTGTPVRAAKRICPEVRVVEARPRVYMEYHHDLVHLLERRFPVVQVLSVDEMACPLGSKEGTPDAAARLAKQLKREITDLLGAWLRCSAGVAANVFLAKVASDMQKPDGLTVLHADNFPEALFRLSLMDLPGIGVNMHRRLAQHGIHTVEALYRASRSDLRRVWGSVVGERWWYMLRGSTVADYGTKPSEVRKSVGHSHVLPPEFRHWAGAQAILARLCTKALTRLRQYEQAASRIEIQVRYMRQTGEYTGYACRAGSQNHLHANDEATWLRILRTHLASLPPPKPGFVPQKVSLVFTGLIACRDRTLDLFAETAATDALTATVDALNARFGKSVGVASVLHLREQAPMRIAFGMLPEDA